MGAILFTLNTFILIVIIVENSYVDFFIDFEAFPWHRSDN
ncbi:putative membrane protein [Shigella flexneri SFJ17B]|nr:putative membrane protein [Shigella flexneri 4343-70]EGM62635.1 putative membrane protein [Shigella flexneri SFJ17B]EIQ76477.1 putative membrane protein [Shigella flexneri 1235-66]